MSELQVSFKSERDAIIQKFAQLLDKLATIRESLDGLVNRDAVITYFEVRVSGLNLIARTAGHSSIYYRELDSLNA